MIIAGVLAVFFTIFTIAMQCDQYETVVTDVTGVESMKHWEEDRKTLRQGLRDLCGPPGLRWVCPVPAPRSAYVRIILLLQSDSQLEIRQCFHRRA